MNELDEELEAQLYAQIHHTTETIEEILPSLDPNSQCESGDENMPRGKRNGKQRYFRVYQEGPSRNYYEKTNVGGRVRPRRERDVSFDQLVVVNPSSEMGSCSVNVENLFYVTNRPSSSERKRKKNQKAQLRKLSENGSYEKFKQALRKLAKEKSNKNTPGSPRQAWKKPANQHLRFDDLPDPDPTSETLENNQPTETPVIPQSTPIISSTATATVISISDSDSESDEECVLIPKIIPTFSVESDDEEVTVKIEKVNDSAVKLPNFVAQETVSVVTKDADKNRHDEDDVIFIQPIVEIIHIDDDSLCTNTQHSPIPKDTLIPPAPDSSQNDFMMSNTSLQQDKFNFNFSLHGSDFTHREFLKPVAVEPCESASSSSTTTATIDVSMLKTAVFSEVEFPRDDLFADANLETFSDSITPSKRVSKANVSVVEDSERNSGSNSETEESVIGKFGNLPNLSHFICERNEENAVVHKKKSGKGKSPLRTTSKLDLAESEKLKKKKKKNKKSKEVYEEEISVITPSKSESVKKKRKSTDESEGSKKKNKATDVQQDEVPADEPEAEEPSVFKEIIAVESTPSTSKAGIFEPIKTQDVAETLEGFLIVDEVSETNDLEAPPQRPIISLSDSDSCLSELGPGTVDIQLGNLSSIPDTNQNPEKPEPPPGSEINLTNSSVSDVQNLMSNDPKLWAVLDCDRYDHLRDLTPVYRGKRCNKCRDFGHPAIRCPKLVTPKCRLCGSSEHYEPRCTNRICHQCGTRSQYTTTYCRSCFTFRETVCGLCQGSGHSSKMCPDLWRRYHLTTEEGPIVQGKEPRIKNRNQIWCSMCAQLGHLEHECRRGTSSFPLSSPYIANYNDPMPVWDSPVSRQPASPFIQPANDRQNDGNAYGRQNNDMQRFLNASEVDLRSYVNERMQGLFKTSLHVREVVGHLKVQLRKRQFSSRFYKTCNTILFGIFHLHDGKSHMNQLKTIRTHHHGMNRSQRMKMFNSFNYIFGNKPHLNVNYERLLNMI